MVTGYWFLVSGSRALSEAAVLDTVYPLMVAGCWLPAKGYARECDPELGKREIKVKS